MKVLVVGSGGREHALAWKIASSPQVEQVLCAPGNAGTERVARNLEIPATDLDGLVRAATSEGVGLVVVGPEDPLVAGLADRLEAVGIPVFGPGADGARLEGSKQFTKELLDRHRIPTATWRRFDRAGLAKSYLESLESWPQVIKADGLAAGKGVFIVGSAAEGAAVIDKLMEERSLGTAGSQVVIEEFLEGQELSVQAITDGRTLLFLDPAVDHKQVGEGDTGPNTGGMGVQAPAPWVTKRLMRQVEQRVFLPALHALQIEDVPFRGVLYAGLMVGDQGPRVLEFNVRFGDPETQVVLRRMKSDLVPYLLAAAEGRLAECESPEWHDGVCIGVVGAAEGYPGSVRKGDVITGVDSAEEVDEAVVFQAGTRREGDHVVTAGGRVLCVTALGPDLEGARERAYAGLDRIFWDGKFCRRDIGLRV
ncbi:MAG: phosphoribosylamine--glycine ligase [Planctomycetota bacterium]|jgi:phosphoribosylamine--glycine ligase